MGRKAATVTEEKTQELAPEVVQAVTDIQQTSSAVISSIEGVAKSDLFLAMESIVKSKVHRGYEEFSRINRTLEMRNVKESKAYKSLKGHEFPNSREIMNGTWEEYCNLLGMSVDKADLDIKNLNEFGFEALESMDQAGISYTQMKMLRKLPDDEKSALIEIAKNGDKEALVDFAETIFEKHTKEKEKLQKQLQTAQDDITAKDEVAEKNAKRMNDLEKRAVLLTKMPLEERTKELRAEISEHVTNIDHELRTNLWNAFENLTVLDGDGHAEFCKKQIEELRAALDQLDQQYGTGEAWME